MSFSKTLNRSIIFLCLFLLGMPAFCALNVFVDKATISLDDQIHLKIESDSSFQLSSNDEQAISANFEITGRSVSRGTSIINGERSSSNSLMLQLAPKKTGIFLIPAISLAGYKSKPIKINVQEESAAHANIGEHTERKIYIETSLEKPSTYVQEQNTLSFKFFSPYPILKTQVELSSIPNVNLVPLNALEYKKHVNGYEYFVREFRYALFAQNSGTLNIPSTAIHAVINAGNDNQDINFWFNSENRIIKRYTPEAHLVVKPVPQGHDKNWLPAKSLVIEQHWKNAIDKVQLGETLTREIQIKAEGVLPEQLNAPLISSSEHLKSYPDAVKKQQHVSRQGVETMLSQQISYIPTKPGIYILPELSLFWWDTKDNRLKKATLAEQQLRVYGKNGASSTNTFSNGSMIQKLYTPTVTKAASDTNRVQPSRKKSSALNINVLFLAIFSAVMLIGLLVFIYFIWRKFTGIKKNKRVWHDAAEAVEKLLKEAAVQKNYSLLQVQILRWAQFHWPEKKLYNLNMLKHLLNKPELSAELTALEEKLYSARDNNWDSQRLLELLSQSKPPFKKERAVKNAAALPPLYPN